MDQTEERQQDELDDGAREPSQDAEVVDRQSERIGGLQRLHVVFVLCSLLVTLGAWQYASRTLEQRNRLRFDRQTDQVAEQLSERLAAHANLLRSTVGFVQSSGDSDRERWRAYAAALDLRNRYPELNGLAVARYLPTEADERARGGRPIDESEQAYQLPIMLTTPPSLARRLEGHDIAFEPERRNAIDRAFADGEVKLTAPILPISGTKPGVVMIAPYRQAPDGAARNDGAVASSMLFEGMMRGALAPNRRTIRLRISDAGEAMLDELAAESDQAVDPQPLFTSVRTLHVYGRDWQLDMQSTLGFRAGAGVATPWLVLAFGLCIDGLLIALLGLHGRAGGRLLLAARQLSEERRALASSNERLETFACVVSHDLKAPLIGIRILVDEMEEDVRDGTDPAVTLVNLQRVRERIVRADTMIDGVMAYSEIGMQEKILVRTEVADLVRQIGATLNVEPRRLLIDCDTPPIQTDPVRLTQVLQNLIGNAFKYHPDPARALVQVVVAELDENWLRVRVVDNGSGIDPALRERVFEPFVTAHGTDRPDSNGVGLAIVRRAVESLGGEIEVETTPGGGTTLAFSWPRHIETTTSSAPPLSGGAGAAADDGELPIAA